jgi:hypothetical protein
MIDILSSPCSFILFGMIGAIGHILMLCDYWQSFKKHKICDEFLIGYSCVAVFFSVVFVYLGIKWI